MAIKIYGKFAAQGLDSEGKPILADAKEIALEQSNNIPSGKDTVQKAIEDLYKNGGGTTRAAQLQTIGSQGQTISMLDMKQWPRTMLASIGTYYQANDGDLYIMYGGLGDDDPPATIVYKSGNNVYPIGEPSEYVVYTTQDNLTSYYWDGSKFVVIPALFFYNINDKKNYRIWVGTQEQYDNIYRTEDDVVYFIGTGTGEAPTPDTSYTVYPRCTNCTLVSSSTEPIYPGGEYRGKLILDEECVLDTIEIIVGGNDIAHTEGVLEQDQNNPSIYNISVQNVNSHIYINAVAILPISRLDIAVGTQKNNVIPLRANLVPSNTSQNMVEWSFVTNSEGTTVGEYTHVTLEVDGLNAYLNIEEDADHEVIYVKCQSVFNSSINKIKAIYDVAYSTSSGGGGLGPGPGTLPPEEEEIDEDTPIQFEDSRVKAKLLPYFGSNGEITIAQAKVYVSGIRTLFAGDTEIETFNEYKYFTGTTFSFMGCTNLREVSFPVRETSSGLQTNFGQQFGLKNTGLTSITIPEGYTKYSQQSVITADGYIAITQGPLITSMKFPTTLQEIIGAAIGGKPTEGDPYLPSVLEIDLSKTQITSLPNRVFNYLCSVDASTGLEVVKLPEQLSVLDSPRIFYKCRRVKKVVFGPEFKGCKTSSPIFDGEVYNSVGVANVTLVFKGDVPDIETPEGGTPNYYFTLGEGRFAPSRDVNRVAAVYVPSEYLSNYTSQSNGFFHDYLAAGGQIIAGEPND